MINTKISSSSSEFQYVELKIFISSRILHDEYETLVAKHNLKMDSTSPFADSGFDLIVPENVIIKDNETVWLNHQIKGSMTYNSIPTGFYLYPRSSISKTPLMLANHVGIVDAGYRGNIIGAFRKITGEGMWTVEKGTRLLQICHPLLLPIHVILVTTESDLGDVTARGEAGFGSTS